MALLHFLQGNINHCAGAQDLLLQSLAEWQIDVAVVAEPYFVPSRDNWAADLDGLVTLVTQGGTVMERVVRRRGCVSASIKGNTVIGVYFSPNRGLDEFERFLADLGELIDLAPSQPVLLAGDFNAKSMAWGSSVRNARGAVLQEWAVAADLSVVNRGSELTCVRQRGGSIVDITFASPPPCKANY
ncbi:uncharacterized protein LOC123703048 [Colias croceus]|uniref:uncharacterized protein LOC123703048 n=1 Tax=Colias crocea TaxID=72248 RepID=UPI001E27C5CA|nr:uncharacterized protein LOC123703048 [Colias croceus]